jgi:hypothetical protein
MKLTAGKKFNGTLAFLFGAFAVVHIITGNIYVGLLEAIIAIDALSDVLEGKETPIIAITLQKGRD